MKFIIDILIIAHALHVYLLQPDHFKRPSYTPAFSLPRLQLLCTEEGLEWTSYWASNTHLVKEGTSPSPQMILATGYSIMQSNSCVHVIIKPLPVICTCLCSSISFDFWHAISTSYCIYNVLLVEYVGMKEINLWQTWCLKCGFKTRACQIHWG